jgi:general secretion pathway protein C
METLFRKYFWTLQLAVLVIAAIMIGAGLTRLLASQAASFAVTVPPASEVTIEEDSGGEVARAVPENAFPITEEPTPVDPCATVECEEGEVCNPSTGECEIDEAALDEDDEQPDEFDPNAPCTDTSLAIGLAGTMVSSSPNWSIAILHNPSTNKTEFARQGSKVLGQAEVIRIQRNRVLIDRGGTIECIRPASVREAAQQRQQQAGSQANNRDSNTRTRTARSARSRGSSNDDDSGSGGSTEARVRQGVSKTGDNSYSIERSALNEVLQNQEVLREQAPRVQPHYRNGRPNGFRLNGLSSDSIFSEIGIRNGDVIHAVNGEVVDSPQKAMQLYQSLMSSNRVELTVERRGQRETLTYQIQ